MTPFQIDWSTIASQGIFAVLFVYLFIDTRNESRRRETTMRDSFIERERQFMSSEQRLMDGLTANTAAIGKLTDLIVGKLAELKEHIEVVEHFNH